MTTNVDETLSIEAREFASQSQSDATRLAYASDWADFADWCEENGCQALPTSPTDLANYLAALATPPRSLKASTITRRCSAIAHAAPPGRLRDAAAGCGAGDTGRDSPNSRLRSCSPIGEIWETQ